MVSSYTPKLFPVITCRKQPRRYGQKQRSLKCLKKTSYKRRAKTFLRHTNETNLLFRLLRGSCATISQYKLRVGELFVNSKTNFFFSLRPVTLLRILAVRNSCLATHMAPIDLGGLAFLYKGLQEVQITICFLKRSGEGGCIVYYVPEGFLNKFPISLP